MPTIELITPTGSRPVAFAICEKLMAEQTLDYDHWTVIDDGPTPTPITCDQTYYRGPKIWKPNINTQRLNLDVAARVVKGDYVFIIEDDDYYSPKYLEVYSKLLEHFGVVGEGNSKYYHLPHASYKAMENVFHSSLCQTAFRKEYLPLFEEAVNSGHLYIDIEFWNLVRKHRVPHVLLTNSHLSIGIKGLPGRTGIGIGHDPKKAGFISDDILHSQLKRWVGDNYNLYKEYLPKRT